MKFFSGKRNSTTAFADDTFSGKRKHNKLTNYDHYHLYIHTQKYTEDLLKVSVMSGIFYTKSFTKIEI